MTIELFLETLLFQYYCTYIWDCQTWCLC